MNDAEMRGDDDEVTAGDGDGSSRAARTSTSDLVVEHLRNAIVSGRLPGGSRLRQEAIAAELGTSRIPIREALRRLESEGLVTIVPNRGARVASVDFNEYVEIYKIREALEPLSIYESASRITDAQIRNLERLQAAIEQAEDLEHWLAADRVFHLATYEPAGLPRLAKMISELQNATQQYRRAYLLLISDEQRELLRAEHRLIVDALRRRDPTLASTRLHAHIRQTRIALSAHRPDDPALRGHHDGSRTPREDSP